MTAPSKKITVLGVPFNGDGTTPDHENPAQSLRQVGLLRSLQSMQLAINDLGDVDIPKYENKRDPGTQILNLNTWLKTSFSVAEAIATIGKNSFLLVLGGDCSILLGIFGGLVSQKLRAGLIMLDGHTDYREPVTSKTGEPADLELAIVTGRGPHQVTQLFGKSPLVEEDDVIVYGYREPDEIEKSAIKRFNSTKMTEMGIMEAAKKGISELDMDLPIWLHFDVDVLDPSIMPVYYPEPGGLSTEEVSQIFQVCFGTGRIIGMSIGCYHPNLDESGRGIHTILSLMSHLPIWLSQ